MMKKKFGELKRGKCFRFTKSGPIHQKDDYTDSQQITGKRVGKVTYMGTQCNRRVYPIKIKIVEKK